MELANNFESLPKIPHGKKNGEVKKVVEQALAKLEGQRDLLRQIRFCIDEVSVYIFPTNGRRAISNEIVIGKDPGSEFCHAYSKSGKSAKKPVKVCRTCSHQCGQLSESLVAAVAFIPKGSALLEASSQLDLLSVSVESLSRASVSSTANAEVST